MSTNHRLFGKNNPPIRVHMEEESAIEQLSEQLLELTEAQVKRELVVVCIGTDRSTGDSLGPLVGTKLEKESLRRFHVYGTLENPVHAVNLEERIAAIYKNHHRPFILAIDACLGRMTSVGKISLADGPVQPGAAVQKNLPAIGDIHMTGIVNVGGMMEYFVLQNTRLHTVMQMADVIASSIRAADIRLPDLAPTASLLRSLRVKSPLQFQTKNKTSM
ncbi:spore protease YyaC [Halalkalibacter akibai]|uniref:Spore protease GPR related protein n=1 Tax=Halalkalibacter akibai (strain ATCC 43226 / DSM 21942 / CIP 109018 / JCM 9157 / 1139) TaxID=1236973 RepID=W4QR89_HALA3|nr:spore protease YyaC [Halalkalibacter akibai]GAE34422.1 spore protease GPR related protein [Halalkalibacter akibai JCM 9157]